MMERQSTQLEKIFNRIFLETENTQLIGGADEPVYLPSEIENQPHRLYYREDYFSSALHEIAHWCIAGAERRKLVDFGYWYNPDGRTAAQQRAFEQVEVKPQALEWLFSSACGIRFCVSADNLSSDDTEAKGASVDFLRAVECQAIAYCTEGLAERAHAFVTALSDFYGTGNLLQADLYRNGLTLG